MDFIFFKNVSRFGIGVDVLVHPDTYEIDLGLGLWTLTVVIYRTLVIA